MSFSDKKCFPCEDGAKPLGKAEVVANLEELGGGWKAVGNYKKIVKEFEFSDFREGIKFVDRVAELADEEGHHPDIYVYRYKRVRIELFTHKIGGLHENDFILASKIDRIKLY